MVILKIVLQVLCICMICLFLILLLGVVQNCHHFQKSTHNSLGGGGDQWSQYAFKNVDYAALHFNTGPIKNNISKVRFWEGGRSQKRLHSVRF